MTASMIPSTQLFAVALGSALCGIIANEAGLAADASPEVAALAGAWLYGGFTVVPLPRSPSARGFGRLGRSILDSATEEGNPLERAGRTRPIGLRPKGD